MPACGLLKPVCDVAGGAVGSAGTAASSFIFESMLNALGDAWVKAGSAVLTTALHALDATTRVDLSAAWFRANLQVMAAVALPVVVGLFVLQVITAVIRREPAPLGRAVVGVVQAMLGTAIALGTTQALLAATDEICDFIAAAAGTTVVGAAKRFLQLTWLTTATGVSPILQMILALAVIVGSLMLWTVLLFRKAALVLVAVFAPVAFAGSVWDVTRAWTRRWIEAVAALVFCKVVIVVVFVVGMSAFGGTGPAAGSGKATSMAQGLSDLMVGILLLGMAICAPWITFRFVHWSGIEAGVALHAAMAASPVPATVKGAASQAKFTAQWAVTSMVLGGMGGGAAGAAGGGPAAGSTPLPPPPPAPPAPPPPAPSPAPTPTGSGTRSTP